MNVLALIHLNPLKPSGSSYLLIKEQLCTLYGFYIILNVNSDYFLKQH
jgi:hypothetical protein